MLLTLKAPSAYLPLRAFTNKSLVCVSGIISRFQDKPNLALLRPCFTGQTFKQAVRKHGQRKDDSWITSSHLACPSPNRCLVCPVPKRTSKARHGGLCKPLSAIRRCEAFRASA